MKKIVKIVEEEYDNWILSVPICFTLVIAAEAFSNHDSMSFIYCTAIALIHFIWYTFFPKRIEKYKCPYGADEGAICPIEQQHFHIVDAPKNSISWNYVPIKLSNKYYYNYNYNYWNPNRSAVGYRYTCIFSEVGNNLWRTVLKLDGNIAPQEFTDDCIDLYKTFQ